MGVYPRVCEETENGKSREEHMPVFPVNMNGERSARVAGY